jgi:glycosyltransferase involved in cell wall biosynthesis
VPKTNVLILTQPGSFAVLGDQLCRLLPYDCRAVDWQKARGEVADVAIALWWHPVSRAILDGMVIRRAVIGCVFDHFSWAASVVGREALHRSLGRFDALVVGSEAILRALRSTYKTLPPTFICETGADLKRFRDTPLPQTFRAMWAGNSNASTGERDLKGIRIIREACEQLGVPLQVADTSDREGVQVQHRDMPAWYSQGSVYLCASESEGTPRPMLEALASGRPVVTTRVGLASRLIHHGINGCIVERSPAGFVSGMSYMHQLLDSQPAKVTIACRRSAEAWGENQMAQKWEEVIETCKSGPWWRGAAIPEAPVVLRSGNRPSPSRSALEAKELSGWSAPHDLLQEFVSNVEHAAGTLRTDRPTVTIPTTYRFLARTLYLIEHLVRDYRFLVGEHATADLCWNMYPFGDWAQTRGMPYVQTMRGQFWHMSERIIRDSIRTYQGASHITTLTRSLYRDLTTRYPALNGIPHTIVHNGHFEREVQRSKTEKMPYQRPILLCVTNFHFEGKIKAVAELARELDRRGFRGTFLVVAQTPSRGLSSPNVGSRGHYLGFHENRLALYRGADLFLYHSYIDGQPTSLIEAMSAGLPAVVGTAPHSGAGEFVIDGKTGLTFSNARDGVAKALELLVQPVRAREMAQAARRWLQDNCTWMGAAAKYDEVFRSVLGMWAGKNHCNRHVDVVASANVPQ